MLRHTLLLIYRNFIRFRSTFLINLVGLGSGLACTLLIYLWVSDELSFDKFHQNDSRLFQVWENTNTVNGITTGEAMPFTLADALVREMPEVEYAVMVTPMQWFPRFTILTENTSMNGEGKFVGEDFFRLFSYPLVQGNAEQVLEDNHSIAISERLATDLFGGSANAIGKTLEWRISHWKGQCTVTGVFQNVPDNSSDRFDFVMPDDRFGEITGSHKVEDFNAVGPCTYVTLKPGSDVSVFNYKLTRYLHSKRKDSGKQSWFVSPYSKNYLYGKFENGVQTGGRIEYVKLFSLIAVFILLIAGINFMNLSTAKAAGRIKEVGIKKAVGANRKVLVFQYLGESLLISFLSMLLAVLVVDLTLPQFNTITGKNLTLTFSTELLVTLCGITFVTGILAGSYPALYLSGFNPARVLKGKLHTPMSEVWVRKGLVIFQFTLSIIFIVAVLVIFSQVQYIQNKNLGYNKDNIISFECSGTLAPSPDAFISKVETLHGVVRASSMISNIITPYGQPQDIKVNGKNIPLSTVRANYGFIETMEIKMAEGRPYSRDFSETGKVIFNETAIKALGMNDPVGQRIDFRGSLAEIIGVVKNFHFTSLYEPVKPLAVLLDTSVQWNVVVRIHAGEEQETIARINDLFRQHNPGFPFDYRFLNADYQALYAAEKRVASLSRYFAGLAILISCLGLFGLAAFTAERRLKEIGIRKVLGSSVFGIVYLLSQDFTRLVIVAIALALPVSYWITQQWLRHFAYRIEPEWWYFTSAGLAALLIAWLTIGLQTLKAARVNPVKCLKEE